ncbi:nitronate monooxygenase [Geminisphaera colitermitum]|uniref:nitronate monooxygenase n=1 Tax=Geminisphaera colitermitum TaxID=1148786 RepID=UPI00019652ED|nr:nitronate monooxygenase [Geminisphaera colitermitum]
MSDPLIIQGGMGVAVSGWPLANAVSRLGQLGVVSGTILAVVLARRLQQGDEGGHMRWALDQFPIQAMATRILERYFVPGGKEDTASFAPVPMPTASYSPELTELTVVANFVEVALAKKGHDGVVGINLLEKVAFPTLASLFGAMLAGVDYVLMGAGIPRLIPGVLDRFARGESAELDIPVACAPSQLSGNGAVSSGEPTGASAIAAALAAEMANARVAQAVFNPVAFMGGEAPVLKRPKFLAIVSSAPLATTLARKATGRVDGFVIEGDTAGGHNAPPRGEMVLDEGGEPVYGARDVADIEKIRALGLPFWLAGECGQPGRLADARRQGAAGVQVGTAFAFCEESGITPALKRQACALSRAGAARAWTDPLASPTGFPFKVLQMGGTLSEEIHYTARTRVCDLGYLRQGYRRADGTLGYRCAAEPEADFVRKGGDISETKGRKCLCNALLATVDLGQSLARRRRAAAAQAQVADTDNSDATAVSSGADVELPLITAGKDVSGIARYIPAGADSYHASDVVRALLADLTTAATPLSERTEDREPATAEVAG